MNKFKLRDVIIIVVIAVAALLIYFFMSMSQKEPGGQVEVTVDGKLYGTYSLEEEQQIEITAGDKVTNVLKIEDGHADMIEADCPDLLCVHQKRISKVNETIICLPNKVVVEVTKGETEVDMIAK